MKEQIGKKLRELRMAKGPSGYTQQAVADDLGISKTTVSEIENGIHNLSTDQLEKFALYFGVRISDILPPPLIPKNIFHKTKQFIGADSGNTGICKTKKLGGAANAPKLYIALKTQCAHLETFSVANSEKPVE